MKKIVILSIALALAATAPALARGHHHRHSGAAVSRTDQGYQPPRWRDEIPFAPF